MSDFSFVKIWLAWVISNFFGHDASSKTKSIVETNQTSFGSYSLMQ